MNLQYDFAGVLERYHGRRVTVFTYGTHRFVGELASIHADCLRLTHAVRIGELEDSRWGSELMHDQIEEMSAPGSPEMSVPLSHVVSISCEDERLRWRQLEGEQDSRGDGASADGESTEDAESGEDTENASDASDAESRESPPPFADPLELRIGPSLIPIADDLVARVHRGRREIEGTLGLRIPPIRIRDDIGLPHSSYAIAVHGVTHGRFEIRVGQFLTINAEDSPYPPELQGEEVREPAFGLPAFWIAAEQRAVAERANLIVVDAASVLITHLFQVAQDRADELLEFDRMVELLRECRDAGSPSLSDTAFATPVSLQRLHAVLCRLLQERVSIAALGRIAETVAWHDDGVRSLTALTERVRREIASIVLKPYLDEQGKLPALLVPREAVEQLLIQGDRIQSFGNTDDLALARFQAALDSVSQSQAIAVVVPGRYRKRFWNLVKWRLPRVAGVISDAEANGVEWDVQAVVTVEQEGWAGSAGRRLPR